MSQYLKHIIWRIFLVFLVIISSQASSATYCPLYSQFPLEIIRSNLYFNQHEILNGLFNSTIDRFDYGDVRFENFQMTYVDMGYSSDRFSIYGMPNRTMKVEIHNLTLHYTTDTNYDYARKVIIETDLKPLDLIADYDKITLEVQLYQVNGNPKARLISVQSLLSKRNRETYELMGQSKEPLAEILQFHMEKHLYGANSWRAEVWLDIIPYGSQVLGGLMYQALQIFGLPIFSDETFIYCGQFLGHDLQYFDETVLQEFSQSDNSNRQKVSSDKAEKGKNHITGQSTFDPTHARIQINQEDFNAEILRLHKSDQIWDLPLSQSIKDSALVVLKEKMNPFKDADSFSVQLFFSEDLIEQFWDSDDYVKSNLKISKDGNLTLQQNLGFYITTYDSDQNKITRLTALMKMNAKIQIQDQKRHTFSNNKQRLTLKIHHIHFPSFQIYNENEDLLNMESMMALVGINLEVNKFVESFDQLYNGALDAAAMTGYIGDIYMESPKDTIGIHWARIHVEAKESGYVAIVFRFENEEFMIDPYRYEAAYRILFKEDKQYLRSGIYSNSTCHDAMFVPIAPFFTYLCQEEQQDLGLSEEEFNFCVLQWKCIQQQYFTTYSEPGKFLEWDVDDFYKVRWRAMFKVHFTLAVIAFAVLKFVKKEVEEEEETPHFKEE